MKVSDFHYDLPPELIAQHPPENRGESRLLKLAESGELSDLMFTDLVDEFLAGDVLVLNDTKVIPARLFGRKESGGRIEVLLERITSDTSCVAQIRSSRSPKIGQRLLIEGAEDTLVTMTGRRGNFFELSVHSKGDRLVDWFERVGHMPLPPYIERVDKSSDQTRYQTVFADKVGAVAAPTAGLHYTDQLLGQIRAKGVTVTTITLHVGAGTYQPVRAEQIEEHQMHAEYVEVNQAVCDLINKTKQNGGRVFAAGTTVVRSLETAASKSSGAALEPFFGETDIFIYPGFKFKAVDVLQTNFHLPESTLLMLVSAFSGTSSIRKAYRHAISHAYRFFSYGDSMLLERRVD